MEVPRATAAAGLPGPHGEMVGNVRDAIITIIILLLLLLLLIIMIVRSSNTTVAA